ncbi:DUF962 domain-containing protein [Aurantiacibacter rhizosphaerae]|uniref:DUF962 domain-containing protein n=1 Tax=Aurantiacibacter rhizosphaerae TaxID=2691582 RepID=A0A844XEV2_9SPHN|nr:Mpo1-like protein [Aurantiacibacter rhizosphaerae]MWV28279.1 DUF962 domain-containing protein [Aurantiacibacter rhizosphaerae]
MSALAKSLSSYREYHRDHRNVATHAVGIPMIVFGVEILLSRPVWVTEFFTLTPAVVATVAAAFYYLKLDRQLGGAMALILIVLAWLGLQIAQGSTVLWLGSGIGLFVVGWIFQLVGHKFEGRKPAFIDDLRSLLIGPIFVLAEALFALGMLDELKRELEKGR